MNRDMEYHLDSEGFNKIRDNSWQTDYKNEEGVSIMFDHYGKQIRIQYPNAVYDTPYITNPELFKQLYLEGEQTSLRNAYNNSISTTKDVSEFVKTLMPLTNQDNIKDLYKKFLQKKYRQDGK